MSVFSGFRQHQRICCFVCGLWVFPLAAESLASPKYAQPKLDGFEALIRETPAEQEPTSAPTQTSQAEAFSRATRDPVENLHAASASRDRDTESKSLPTKDRHELRQLQKKFDALAAQQAELAEKHAALQQQLKQPERPPVRPTVAKSDAFAKYATPTPTPSLPKAAPEPVAKETVPIPTQPSAELELVKPALRRPTRFLESLDDRFFSSGVDVSSCYGTLTVGTQPYQLCKVDRSIKLLPSQPSGGSR